MIKKLLSWILVLVALAGCTDSAEPDPSLMGYQYYPLAVGDYRVYFVTDIRYKFNIGDTTRFQIREEVKSTFVDQTNTLNYRIERSLRSNSSSQWVSDSVFVVSKSLTNVLLTKNNTKRVKLIFPVKFGKTWAGDAYNDRIRTNYDEPKEPYAYAAVHEPFEFNQKQLLLKGAALRYDSTATVLQGTNESVIRLDDRKEVYAAGVGMVYRLFNRANYARCFPEDCEFGEKYKLDGQERHEVLVEHGKI